jgi:hypothetical protein
MIDLNTLIDPLSGWELQTGWAMNDAGQITGIGFLDGKPRAFLLTAVPEPNGIVGALFGFLGVFATRARSCELSSRRHLSAAE